METIAELDRQIDAIQARVRRAARIRRPWDAMEWDRAWAQYPDLLSEAQALLARRDHLRYPEA